MDEYFASIIEQFGKSRALKNLKKSESEFCKSHQACFANKESLNNARSLKPIPPFVFDFVISSYFNQWIFLLSPL